MARRNSKGKPQKSFFISNKLLLALLCVSAVGFALVALSFKLLANKEPSLESESENPSFSAELSPGIIPADSVPSSSKTEDIITNSEETPYLPESEKISYQIERGVRGAYLSNGREFSLESSEEEIKSQIDNAFSSAKELGINSLFIELISKDGAIYNSKILSSKNGFDTYNYIEEKAKAEGLRLYGIFDLSLAKSKETKEKYTLSPNDVNFSITALTEFAKGYNPDGIALKGYYSINSSSAYEEYLCFGGGMGFEDFEREETFALVKNARSAVFEAKPQIPVGIVADSVWANESENKDGTKTSASFTSLCDGNADTKLFAEMGLADFIMEQNLGAIKDSDIPFESQIKWWNEIGMDYGVPVLACHSSKKALEANGNWKSPDEITRQALIVKNYYDKEQSAVLGSVFDSLNCLAEDESGSTELLLKFYGGKVKKEHVLKDLAVTNPTKLSYITFDPSVNFTGASDPNFKTEFNGEEIKTDSNGFFSISAELKEGLNKFTFVHKGKTVTYSITRKIELLKELSPEGNIALDGNMELPITAIAIDGAEVFATIGGQTIPMHLDETQDDLNASHNQGGEAFKRYIGFYQTPEATSSAQKIGNVTVTAKWQGFTKSKQGAFITVNKKPTLEGGVLVRVINDDAMTFPTNKLDNDSSPQHFPLAKGTLAYTVGNELSYKTAKNTYTYYNLSSGQRVYSKDIAPAGSGASLDGNNEITGLTVSADYAHTDVILVLDQKVPYNCKYNGSSFSISFDFTKSVPSGMSLDKNPLFSKASWNGATLKLDLLKNGVFLGVKTFYNSSGNLVFRFTNPPRSLNGARITIDPGHHIKDPGAPGFNPYYPEQVINWGIASKLASLLEDSGARVNLLPTNSTVMKLDPRIASAKRFDSQLFISIHNNSSRNSSATGTEVFYFNDFSKAFAQKVAVGVSNGLATANRGAKFAHYIVTKDMQYPSVLVECGFLTNRSEYNKLLSDDYQWDIARGIRNACDSYFKSVSGNYGITGTESVGDRADTSSSSSSKDYEDSSASSGGSSESSRHEPSSQSISYEEIIVKSRKVSLKQGEEYKIHLESEPEGIKTSDVYFDSLDAGIVEVDKIGLVTALSSGKGEIEIIYRDNPDVRESIVFSVE